MGVMCQILLNKPREGVYRAGKAVTGTLKYAVDEPTEYKNILLSLVGKGRCEWSESRSTDESDDTYTGTEVFVSQHNNVLRIRPNETVTLEIGSYEYPFVFYLPNDLPPTYKDNYCRITYQIKVKFEKSAFFSITRRFNSDLNIYSNVNPIISEPAIYGFEKSLFKLFSRKENTVNLKAEIAKTLVMPGEKIQVNYVVKNNTDVVPTVKTKLISEITYTANCGRKKTDKKTIKGCFVQSPSISKDSVGKFVTEVPTTPELYSIQHAKIISRMYKLEVTVELPMPHFDAGIEIPIVIGERAGAALQLDSIAGEEPPSYWEVMAEDKMQEESDMKK